jgi:DNA repair photolyase
MGRQADLFVSRTTPRLAAQPLRVLAVRQRGVEFVEHAAKSIINAPESTGMGFWSINPYVGCELGCSYCYARFAHYYLMGRRAENHAGPVRGSGEPFEQRIFVKQKAHVLEALERDLAKVRRRGRGGILQNLVIGTATDPYQPAERQYLVTRAVLQRLRSERALHIGVITKSPLVCRDLDVFTDLTRFHRVSIYVSLMSVDVRLIKLFETRSPMPHARLRALRRLTHARLRAGLLVAPVLPGVTDTAAQVAALMAAGRDAGARFVYPSVLRMYADARQRFLPLVQRHFPDLANRYAAAYGKRRDAPNAYVDALRERFRRIARRFDIPETDGDREQPREVPASSGRQLSLW